MNILVRQRNPLFNAGLVSQIKIRLLLKIQLTQHHYLYTNIVHSAMKIQGIAPHLKIRDKNFN